MSAGIYIHIPFCKSRCSYCDFATDVYRNDDAVERYVSALSAEIEKFSIESQAGLSESNSPRRTVAASPRLFNTIYFGGGTPSLLSPKQLEKILNVIHAKFSFADEIEFTLEMNPATVTLEKLRDYKSLGVNRASFGVQTFDDIALKLLARGHDAQDARDTFRLLREANFENISFDLIAGLPNQTLEDWSRNLDEALKLEPEHLSLYLLEIHEGTPLAEQVRSHRQPKPDENLAAEMYELIIERVCASGFKQYEISNFAKRGFESRHNTKYWRLDPVYGFGVSAHSFDGAKTRMANERDTNRYVELIESEKSAVVMREEIKFASEFIFLGLRMTDGVRLSEFENRFGEKLTEIFRGELAQLQTNGLISINEQRIALTRRGMLFSNEVFAEFI